MKSLVNLGHRGDAVRFGSMLVLLGACFLGGGASRLDVLSLVYVQPLAVICLAVFLFTADEIRWSSVRAPLALVAALAWIMVVQLLPLPPALWTSLPGHGQFAVVAEVVGVEQPWRPISLTPDLTLASLVSLSVPAAVLVGFASLTVEQTRRLLPFLIAGVALSALLGLVQVSSGGRSSLYFYEITNIGSPVGVFANRNHQAALLAMGWPMLALWVSFASDPARAFVFRAMALALAIFLLPMIMATGSRGGVLLGGLALTISVGLWWRHSRSAYPGRGGLVLAGVGLLCAFAVVVATIVLARDEAVQRMTGIDPAEEVRLQFFPTLARIALDFFPVGAGFGSFDPLFRTYEPFELLQPAYLNHAHNDLIELAIVGGLPALIVVALFASWFLRRALPLVRGVRGRQSVGFAQLGAVMVLMLSLSSLVDYPLRTPLMAALACIACGWLADYRQGKGSPAGRPK